MHQNILAVLYYITGYITSYIMIFLGSELAINSFGVLLSIYMTYIVVEQFYKN